MSIRTSIGMSRGRSRAVRAAIAIAVLGAIAAAVGIVLYAGPVAGDDQAGTGNAETGGLDGGEVSVEDAPTPAPLSGPGIRMIARARPDGTFDVVESIVLREPQSWLVLSPPVPAGVAKRVKPTAEDVRLTSEGEVVSADTDVIDASRDVYLSAPVTRVELRYKLTGVSIRSTASHPRRALSLIAPLSAPTDETLRATMSVTNALVRVVLCPELPEDRRYCSPDTDPPGDVTGVVSNVAAGDSQAQYQLDLPTS